MKRDMDLIRKILLKLEEHEHGHAPEPFKVEGYTDELVGFHVHLMGEAGLLRVANITGFDDSSPMAIPSSILPVGYDFLDAARNDKIWAQVKKRLADEAVSVPITVFLAMLKAKIAEKLGLQEL
jgi:hypothetical protein